MVQPQPPYRQTGTPLLDALTRHGALLSAVAAWLPATRARLPRPDLTRALRVAALAAGPYHLWALGHMDHVTASMRAKRDAAVRLHDAVRLARAAQACVPPEDSHGG